MRTVYDQRRDNPRALTRQWGGPTSLSRKLGHSNGSYLAQLAGPHPIRLLNRQVRILTILVLVALTLNALRFLPL